MKAVKATMTDRERREALKQWRKAIESDGIALGEMQSRIDPTPEPPEAGEMIVNKDDRLDPGDVILGVLLIVCVACMLLLLFA